MHEGAPTNKSLGQIILPYFDLSDFWPFTQLQFLPDLAFEEKRASTLLLAFAQTTE